MSHRLEKHVAINAVVLGDASVKLREFLELVLVKQDRRHPLVVGRVFHRENVGRYDPSKGIPIDGIGQHDVGKLHRGEGFDCGLGCLSSI